MIFSYSCASNSPQESTPEQIDDSVITSKVKTAIFNEPILKSLEVNIHSRESSSSWLRHFNDMQIKLAV